MGVMRNIIAWCDKKTDEAYVEKDDRKAYTKAFVSGFVEGACDAAVVLYPVVLIACYIYQNKLTEK